VVLLAWTLGAGGSFAPTELGVGPAGSAQLDVRKGVGVRLQGAGYFQLGEPQGPSRVGVRADAVLVLQPVHLEFGAWSLQSGLFTGFGALRSVDDPGEVQNDDVGFFDATAIQWHPAAVAGLQAELTAHERVGVRLRVESALYTETLNGIQVYARFPGFVGLELILRSGVASDVAR
jgi:hypothetical protein